MVERDRFPQAPYMSRLHCVLDLWSRSRSFSRFAEDIRETEPQSSEANPNKARRGHIRLTPCFASGNEGKCHCAAGIIGIPQGKEDRR